MLVYGLEEFKVALKGSKSRTKSCIHSSFESGSTSAEDFNGWVMKCVISDWRVRNKSQMPNDSTAAGAVIAGVGVGRRRRRRRPPPWVSFARNCSFGTRRQTTSYRLVHLRAFRIRATTTVLLCLHSASPTPSSSPNQEFSTLGGTLSSSSLSGFDLRLPHRPWVFSFLGRSGARGLRGVRLGRV